MSADSTKADERHLPSFTRMVQALLGRGLATNETEEPTQPSTNLVVIWGPQAENVLRKRGNHTRHEVHAEFELKPLKEALCFDETRQLYVTPVGHHRYSVIWQMDGVYANVLAFVPTRFAADLEAAVLKVRVRNIVLHETAGSLDLYAVEPA